MTSELHEAIARLEERPVADVDVATVEMMRASPMYSEGDEDAPVMSEAFLYPLLGKEAARTVLARWAKVCRAAGLPDR